MTTYPDDHQSAFLEHLREFLWETHWGIYRNSHGVEFAICPGGTVLLCSRYPGYSPPASNVSLSLTQIYSTISEFSQAFSFQQLSDLDKITPHQLLYLQKEGKIAVTCYIDDLENGCNLEFSIKGNFISLLDEETGNNRLFKATFTDPEQFLKYSRQYATHVVQKTRANDILYMSTTGK